MGMKPSNKTCSGLVQKYSNTAFDINKALYDNLDLLRSVYGAVIPAHQFKFGLDYTNQWTLVSGEMEVIANGLKLKKGDILSPILNFNAEENPIMQFSMLGLVPFDWLGDIVLYFEDSTEVVLVGVIPEPNGQTIVNVDLSGQAGYTGVIKQIGLRFGISTATELILNSLVISSGVVSITALGEFTKRIDIVYDKVDLAFATAELAISTSADTEQQLVELETTTNQRFADNDVNITNLSNRAELNFVDLTLDNPHFTGVILDNSAIVEKLKALPGSIEITSPTGDPRYFWDGVNSQWVHKGNLILGDGTPISSLEDLRALDGENAINVYLTQDAYNASTDSTGTNIVYVGSGGSMVLVRGTTPVTEGVVYSGGATKNGLTLTINPTTGAYTIAGALWSTDTEFFDLTATYNTIAYIKRFTVTKVRQGSNGVILNTGTLTIYTRTVRGGVPPELSGDVSFNFDTQSYTGMPNNGWTSELPSSALPLLWAKQYRFNTSLNVITITSGSWSASRLISTDGVEGPPGDGSAGGDGPPGAGMYSGSFASFDWSVPTANNRFSAIVGRQPVFGDIFVQINTTTGGVQSREWNGAAWVTPTLQIDGSLVVTGTIAGDKIVAGTVITSPIIRGGKLELTGEVASTHFTILSNDPFGPNNLIEWFGPKIPGVNWNTSLNNPIYSGMTKGNAITYKGADGSWYTSGSILAGTLRTANQTSALSNNTNIESGLFGSNGGIITIKCSFAANKSTGLVAGGCPVSPTNNPPTGTMYLDKKITGSWVQVASQPFTGNYQCYDEGPEHIETWNASSSFTHTDPEQSTVNREFRLRVIHDVPVFGGTATQRLSIITEE